MCGIIGVLNCPKAAELIYLGLHAIQHRAQEYAGIVTSDGGLSLFRFTGPGILQDVFNQNTLDLLHGQSGVGHIRYSTMEDNPKLDNTQPIIASFANREVALVHNGNLINYQTLRTQLEKQYGPFKTSMDTEVILRLFCQSNQAELAKRIFDAVCPLRGTYSLIFLFNDVMIAVRDPWGNRPLSLGKRNGSWFVCSETVAFDNLGIETVREIAPGEILIIKKDSLESWYFDEQKLSQEPMPHRRAHCIFELLYFAHPDSEMFDGQSVVKFRLRAGAKLCQTCPSAGKTVVAVPDSALFHAEGFAEADPDAKLVLGLLRSHYIGRTFIEGLQRLRVSKVSRKFTALKALLKNAIVTLVDDSVVRFNTLPDVVRLVLRAGAKAVHIRITTPPVTHPCKYGLDKTTKTELIAANLTVEAITAKSGAATLQYMSLPNLKTLVPNPEDYCFACMDGDYPIKED